MDHSPGPTPYVERGLMTGEEGYPGTKDCSGQMEVECASPWTKNRGQ